MELVNCLEVSKHKAMEQATVGGSQPQSYYHHHNYKIMQFMNCMCPLHKEQERI